MEPAVLSSLVIACGSMLVAIITTRQNRQGQKDTKFLEERVVNRDDFEKVMERMEKDLQRSDKAREADSRRITDLENRLEAEVQERVKADRKASDAEKRAADAEKRADRLERRVAQLEQVLEEHNIPVPPLPDE